MSYVAFMSSELQFTLHVVMRAVVVSGQRQIDTGRYYC